MYELKLTPTATTYYPVVFIVCVQKDFLMWSIFSHYLLSRGSRETAVLFVNVTPLVSFKGYKYKMRSVYAHFPINVAIEKNQIDVEVRNFLGEKFTRKVSMLPGVTCKSSTAQKDELILEGNDIELVSRSGL